MHPSKPLLKQKGMSGKVLPETHHSAARFPPVRGRWGHRCQRSRSGTAETAEAEGGEGTVVREAQQQQGGRLQPPRVATGCRNGHGSTPSVHECQRPGVQIVTHAGRAQQHACTCLPPNDRGSHKHDHVPGPRCAGRSRPPPAPTAGWPARTSSRTAARQGVK